MSMSASLHSTGSALPVEVATHSTSAWIIIGDYPSKVDVHFGNMSPSEMRRFAAALSEAAEGILGLALKKEADYLNQ